jgi:glycosidase
VENHDEDRYLEEYGEGALRAAAATFTLLGAPMVYYGQERGATDYRGPMPWHDGDAALTAYHRSLSRCRAARPALRSGGVERLDRTVIGGDPEAVTAYARDDGDERLLVALHFGQGTATVDPGERHGGTDLLTDDEVGEGAVAVEDCVVLRGRR